MQIQGQTAFVTGAASGLGAATARRLAGAGARVALLDLSGSRLAAAAEATGGTGVPCDVSDGPGCEAAFADAQGRLGPPRVVVHCAGIAPPNRVVGKEGPGPLGDFARVISVNLVGTFNVLRVAATAMSRLSPLADGERGVVVNTASAAAYEGQVGQTAYAASKGGVAALTLPAARELARFGIRVVAIAPGLFGTPMMHGMPQELQDRLAATVPFPPRFGDPDEYARLVEHIVGNPMLNGEVIRLDGALRMQPR
jgi:NAD(P)-dependent dehydrogenase (short-subunit alcohol dehydrogenase family)